MENILSQLIFLDQRAKEITASAENEFANIDRVVKMKTAEILEEAEANASIKILGMQEDNIRHIETEKEKINNESQVQFDKIKSEWSINSDKWRKEIVSAIIDKKESSYHEI